MRAILLALVLAGCVGPEPPPEPEPRDGFVLTGEACREVVVGVAVDLPAVQGLLPEGFVASDAGVLFGVPVATGKGLFALANMDCAAGNLTTGGATTRALFHLGEFVVAIEPPEGAPTDGALYAYELQLVHADGLVGAAFARIGWNATEGLVARQSERAPVGGPVVFDQTWQTEELTYRGRGTYDPTNPSPVGTRTYVYHGPLAEGRVVTFEGDFALAPPSTGTFEASPGSALATLAGERGPATVLYVTASEVAVRPFET